jgi:hypothetical protein
MSEHEDLANWLRVAAQLLILKRDQAVVEALRRTL